MKSRFSCQVSLWLLGALCSFQPSVAAQVRVWEDSITLPTYEEGLPDINPPFDLFNRRTFRTYPYTTRENLTQRKSDRRWRTLNLENEYLKVVVLPDLGGRLYSCVDKSNGAELFYANPSIKFAQVAYRGAWLALGIEFNFPVSHNWMTVSPVDLAIREDPDGSASIWVGNIDRVYGMMWRVALTLHPGSSLLEQTVTLYNPDSHRHRYYWWNTASVQSWDDSRIIYPMKYTASHGFTNVDSWPVDSTGNDLSIPGNHTRGFVSRFAHGSREPFMGVYHPRTGAGVVHFAFIDEVPGKKIWSWGWDEVGRSWRKALSDNDSSYLEVQAGLFRNQETYSFLEPQQFLRFKEYYMPVRRIGGFSRASLGGVLHLQRERSALRIGVNVNREVAGGKLTVRNGDVAVLEIPFDLTPSGAFDRIFPELSQESPYTVEVTTATGERLLAHTEGLYDLLPDEEIQVGNQIAYRVPPPDSRSEGDFVELGKEQELNGRLLAAIETYLRGLERFPDSFELNKAAGRLSVQLKRFSEAVTRLRQALARIDNDPEVLYYLGNAWAHSQEEERARAAWERAAVLPGFRIPVFLELALLSARKGRLSDALLQVQKALSDAPRALRAGCLEVVILRRMGEIERARGQLSQWQRLDPPNSFLRHEAVLLGGYDERLWQHLAGDPERVLEMAVEYIGLGCYEDALQLLNRSYPATGVSAEPGAALPQDHPLIAYYRGYCREKLGQSGRRDFELASQLSTRFVFASRAATLPVLNKALEVNPADATAHFLRGAIYLSGGIVDSAIEDWEQARRLNPHLPTLHRNIGFTQLLALTDPEAALETFQEGLEMDPSNRDIYLGIDQALSLLDRDPSERVSALQRFPGQEAIPPDLLITTALALTEAHRFEQAEKSLAQGSFIREEFGTNVHDVWVEVQLQKALADSEGGPAPGSLIRKGFRQTGRLCESALAVAETLGKPVPGIPFTGESVERFLDGARVQYLLGEIQNRCGKPEAARHHWAKASEKTGYRELYFGYLAARQLGEVDEPGWQKHLGDALSMAEAYGGSSPGLAMYAQGALLRAMGEHAEGDRRLRQVFLMPDKGMAHYLSREMLHRIE